MIKVYMVVKIVLLELAHVVNHPNAIQSCPALGDISQVTTWVNPHGRNKLTAISLEAGADSNNICDH
jgi:hypothetical protein